MKRNCISAFSAAEVAAGLTLRFRPAQLGLEGINRCCLFRIDKRSLATHIRARSRCKTSVRNGRQPIASTTHRRAESTESVSRKEVVSNISIDVKRDDNPSALRTEAPSRPHHVDTSNDAQRPFFVDLMRTVPHPVVVITARRQDVEDDAQGTVGATVSSFNTVSLAPDLVVSFNLRSDSITYQTILESKHFTVTFPQMNTDGAKLVHIFTKGNTRSPFTVEDPNLPRPYPIPMFSDEDLSRTSFHIKERPPAVSLTDSRDFEGSGFAFAFVCEYQTSVPAGDHVVITGRLSPVPIRTSRLGWGGMRKEAPWSKNFVTLAHVHGTYSSSDTGLGFVNLWKQDDPYINLTEADVNPTFAVNFYQERLRLIHTAQMARLEGKASEVVQRKAQGWIYVERALSMPIELLGLYERHYLRKLAFWQKKASGSFEDGGSLDLAEDPPAQEPLKKPEVPNTGNVTFSELPGHQQLLVRSKSLLSVDELNEELALYKTRLAKLRSNPNPTFRGGPALGERDSDSNFSSERNVHMPDERLQAFFEQRIHFLELALSRKAEYAPPAPSSVESTKRDGEQAMKRLVNAMRHESMQSLKSKYKRYQLQITEARLSMIGQTQLPDNERSVQILQDRIRFFEPRIQAVTDVISLRVKSSPSPAELAKEFLLPPMQHIESWRDVPKQKPKPKVAKRAVSESIKRASSARSKSNDGINATEGDSVDQLNHDEIEQSGVKSKDIGTDQDYLVMQHFADEVIPSPDDAVDVKKIKDNDPIKEKGKEKSQRPESTTQYFIHNDKLMRRE